MHLTCAVFYVDSPDSLAHFYTDRLGMTASRHGDTILLACGGQSASLELRAAPSGRGYVPSDRDRYWKIGITLPNVDIAQAQLRAAGVQISEARQFLDIGYMCHLRDPEGFQIELLQHDFEQNRPPGAGDAGEPLGGGAAIGQITLRVVDIEAALSVYRDRLGMRLLSVQPLPQLGFTLYFLAFTDETPPLAPLEAVENREWLWRRPYTTLELQHLHDAEAPLRTPAPGAPGFAHIAISGCQGEEVLTDEIGGRIYLFPESAA